MVAYISDGWCMRISNFYNLGRTQPTLDFVDVRFDTDTALFLSPRALALLPSAWGQTCVHLIQDFFGTVLDHIRNDRHGDAESLLRALKEPNETHLGLSKGRSRGHALGEGSAHDVWAALTHSKAAKSGLLTDLEDTVLFIRGIGVDIISDVTTNIIRGPLIEYTQAMAQQYGVPLVDGIPSGPIWDPSNKDWVNFFTRLPMTPEGKLLLVPKAIVRVNLAYSVDEYYRHYLVPYLQQRELDAHSSLVHTLKDKTRVVYKNRIEDKYGTGKDTVVDETIKAKAVFDRYKSIISERPFNPLEHERIAAAEGQPAPDWDALLAAVTRLPAGAANATNYEKSVEALLTALFYPDLVNPIIQHPLHDGRKRVDITYVNSARGGFFRWINNNYSSAQIFVECKNYGKELGNPELDQLSGRFSPSRGKVGILVCRSFENKALFLKRCKDTMNDDRGWILALDDDDLAQLVEFRKSAPFYQEWTLLDRQFRALIN